MKSFFCAAALSVLAMQPAMAQSVPPLETHPNVTTLPEVPMISSKRLHLDAKESHGVSLADEWKNHPDKPHRGNDGSVVYLYGATLPTMVCTPLHVCAIKLQPGEILKDFSAGDTVRWNIHFLSSGEGSTQTTMVTVKPSDAGIITDLLIMTDRRTYTVKLASTQKSWIPVLSFDYPDDVNGELAAYQARQKKDYMANTLPSGPSIYNLDFNFRISGDRPRWKPLRVYSDGKKTYIQFASSDFGGDAPTLVQLGNDGGLFRKPSQQIINYRVIGDRYVVDTVLDRAALISGVGRMQTRVMISHGGR
ncbi:P-type conjugative transfer protein TrbG [Brucella sp. NBRC 12950]|uniref:P-type conjugative transfer protein TrbG n=1 Tax=Brucella sp. NBRC 12950 TaxID=2994518 RepID=UPI002553570F|nr:P-type conjugative transfer protein TrbG [Brucella sp. NBRC 12950]